MRIKNPKEINKHIMLRANICPVVFKKQLLLFPHDSRVAVWPIIIITTRQDACWSRKWPRLSLTPPTNWLTNDYREVVASSGSAEDR